MSVKLDFIEQSGLGAGFVYKNEDKGYFFNGTSFTQITSPNYPTETVRGIVYLDGTYYVMDRNGFIYGSEINDPATWDALNVISSQSEPDLGVCLARQLNLVVAFGAYSTEFFYNAANPTGSPLLPYTSAFLEVGCAHSGSVINAENQVIFMGVTRQKGRDVRILEGTVPKTLSTPYVERLLNAADLGGTTSYFIKIQGHGFYVLSIPYSDLTLVCDLTTGKWARWTQLKPRNNTVFVNTTTSMVWDSGRVTAFFRNHLVETGDIVKIENALPVGYNGTYIATKIDDNYISYELIENPGTYVSGATLIPYQEGYFNMGSYTKSESFDLVQDSTTGIIYAVSTTTYQDNELPIKYYARTSNSDGGNNLLKFYSRLELIGDKIDGTGYMRFSDDDYRTWNTFRSINLSNQRSQLYRNGSSRRRAYELTNFDNLPIRLSNIEVSVDKGYT